MVVTTTVYFLNPAPGSHPLLFNLIWGVATAVCGVALVARQLVARVHEYGSSGERPAVGLETLASVLFVVAVVFAGSYFALSRRSGQFSGISNHIDALYFSMTVLSTAGFGDVHATGQLARILVMVQMLFDLVFVAAAVGLVVSSIVARRQGATRPPEQPAPGSPENPGG